MATTYAKGGRKTSTSRVYLSPAKGETSIEVNGTPLEKYFSNQINITTVKRPLELVKGIEGETGSYKISAFVKGGGTTGQAESLRHGIARAFSALGEAPKKAMKAENLLTRDDRKVECKKPGRRKARKVKQWTKR